MAAGTGLGSFVGTAPETVWGTAVAATAYNRYVSQDFVPNSDETPGDESLGIAFTASKDIYHKRMEGSITFDSRYQGLDRWLKNLFGAPTSTNGSGADAGAYTHVYTLKTARPVGMTMELHLEIMKCIVAGLKLNKLSAAMGVGIQRLTFSGIGKAVASPPGSAATGVTFVEDVSGITPVKAIESGSPAAVPGTPAVNDGFTLGIGTAGTFGSPTFYCSQEPATINIEAPLKTDDICLGDPGLAEPTLNGKFAVSGAFPRQLVDDDFIEHFNGNDAVYLRMKYCGPGPVIPAGATFYTWQWDIPYARIKKALGPVANAGAIIEQVEWLASPPTGVSADCMSLTVVNKLTAVT